jgi:hypothetical protein
MEQQILKITTKHRGCHKNSTTIATEVSLQQKNIF